MSDKAHKTALRLTNTFVPGDRVTYRELKDELGTVLAREDMGGVEAYRVQWDPCQRTPRAFTGWCYAFNLTLVQP